MVSEGTNMQFSQCNEIQPNLKLKLTYINETNPSHCQEPQPQSGSSSVLLASSNVIDL